MTDECTLIKGLRVLDPQTITSIHRSFYSHVYRYAHYRIGDDIVAEDVASETFTRLLEAVNNGRGPRKNIRGWLMGTVSNLINDYYRAIYKHPQSHLSEQVESQAQNPSQNIEKRELERELRGAVLQLSSSQQHVLTLRFGNGYSLEETAQVMGKKVNAVKQLQFRAVTAIRRNLRCQE
jgi:RNA polymerase sigma-70 factor, ECF subfamily